VPFTGSTTDGSQLDTIGQTDTMKPLSGPSNFDDGFCAVSTDNTMGRQGPIPCKSNFSIPADATPGIYALYWVWNFPKLETPGYSELYTTCMDVEVVAGNSSSSASVSPVPDTPVAPPPAVAPQPSNGDRGPRTITHTRHHTKTVPGAVEIITKTVIEMISAAPVLDNANVVIQTLSLETFITLTRTVAAAVTPLPPVLDDSNVVIQTINLTGAAVPS
jgi:hypothetical protein